MSTTAGTIVKSDPRQELDGGKHNPFHHIVRIVVTNVAVSSEERHGPGHSHGLADKAREAAEAELKKMGPPPPDAAPAGKAATSSKPTNMFEALKPTDIVVMGSEPASVRVLDKDGKPVPLDENGQPVPPDESRQRTSGSTAATTRRLFAHDDRHKDTVLRVWTESDTVEYQCDRPFTIEEVKRAGWHIHRSPANLFARERQGTPYTAVEDRTMDASGNLKVVFKWTSGTVPASANNQQYKMTFKIDGELIDPDIVCGDPPPVPGP